MATWIVGGVLALLLVLIVWKLIKDKKAGKSAFGCDGDCSHCNACVQPEHDRQT